MASLVVDTVEFLGAGFAKTSVLDAAAKQKMVGLATELNARILRQLPAEPHWPAIVAAHSSGPWPDNKGGPTGVYNAWNTLGLPAFGLLKWLRNFFSHVGQMLTKGFFENRADAETYVVSKFGWLQPVIEDFQRERVPLLRMERQPQSESKVI